MKHMKEVLVPAKTEKRRDYTTCDLCKQKINEEWRGDYAEVDVCCKIGVRWPDGGNYDQWEFDLCADCFQNKLVPWMKSQGADPAISDCDW